ncbi:NAD(P)-binding protein [Aquincola tertiaricarbonis]|uniref:NAD(P)-binding protein n=1 Tax=Aquincola tertiaricarbonis TaxID=391953 RepID=A0ABY4S834_AQUTE|nr:FAD-dependent monooxygenase [Aquincola tertiaricarbonis]URI07251.1 NAD(P)-binding protein [Aquincola tertiaricarbonis]
MAIVQRVGIVGAGLGGLAAAVAAARAGMQVEVFEARAHIAQPAVHVEVAPNLLRELAGLGVAEACVRRGFPFSSYALFDSEGRQHDELPAPPLAGPPWPPALGLTLADLLALLRDAAQAHRVRLHLGCAVHEVQADATVLTEDGGRHRFDLTAIATGQALPLIAGRPAQPVPTTALPLQACLCLLPRPVVMAGTAWVLCRGAGGLKRVGLVPVDTRRAGVALLLASHADTRHAALRDALAGENRLLRGLGAQLHDEVPVQVCGIANGLLPGPWHQGAVLRIGRSAHRLPPYFGQGPAQVVEDACVLGDLLRQGLTPQALGLAFSARRQPRVQQVLQVALQAARWQAQPESTTDLRALAETLQPLVAEPA